MSWDPWANLILADQKGKYNTGGLICDLQGNIWATAGSLNNSMKFTQMATMCKKVFEGGAAAQGSFFFPDEGCPGAQKYMVVRCEENDIIGKKGQSGVTITKHKNEGYIVGMYEEPIQPGSSRARVYEVAEQLRGPSN